MENQEPKVEKPISIELTKEELETILNKIYTSDAYDESNEEDKALVKKLQDKLYE